MNNQPDAQPRKSPWLEGVLTPCDPKIFLEAMQTWSDASSKPLPEPKNKAPGLRLTDIPINRSALRTVAFLRERGVAAPHAYLWRLMHLHEVFEQAAAYGLADHVRDTEISSALITGMATARVNGPDAQDSAVSFDMADVAAKTLAAAAAAEGAGEGS